jgi:hypothetical protein
VWSCFDPGLEDGSEDLVRVRRICFVLAAHEDCLPFCIYEGGSPQTSPPQTSISTIQIRTFMLVVPVPGAIKITVLQGLRPM